MLSERVISHQFLNAAVLFSLDRKSSECCLVTGFVDFSHSKMRKLGSIEDSKTTDSNWIPGTEIKREGLHSEAGTRLTNDDVASLFSEVI